MIKILRSKTFFGSDAAALVETIPIWRHIGERDVVVTRTSVKGVTEYPSFDRAVSQLSAYLSAYIPTRADRSESRAVTFGRREAPPPQPLKPDVAQTATNTYQLFASDPARSLLQPGTLDKVQAAFGAPDKVTQQTIRRGQDRPKTLTFLSYGDAAIVFVLSDYRPASDSVDRVIFDTAKINAALLKK